MFPTRRQTLGMAAALGATGLTGCTVAGRSRTKVNSEVGSKANAALKAMEGKVLSKGPNGEDPSGAETVELTSAEVEEIRAKGARAAIVMHYAGNDWAVAQIAGLQAEFEHLGIEVIAITDANFNPGTQVSNLETVMAKSPDAIVSIPTDPIATVSAYRKVVDAGVALVFMDNVPQGFSAGEDYVSCVSADNYGNGVVSAHLLARALNGHGKIGEIFYSADFFVTNQRYEGFKKTIAEEYPNIQVLESQGVGGPDFAGDAQKVTDAMLSKNPEIEAIWAIWDVPAEGVLASVRSAGRSDIKIATEDLGTNVAIALAQDRFVVGLGSQQPYQQGVAEARIIARKLLGLESPPYVALNALPVTHENVLEAWTQVYNTQPPAALKEAMAK